MRILIGLNDRRAGGYAALAALFAAALGLRLWGLGFGMPIASNLYIRPDETILLVPAALFFSSAGHPVLFAYPALFHLIAAVSFEIVHAIRTVGGIAQATGLGADFLAATDSYFLTGRAISVLAGTICAVLVLVVARRFAGLPAAAAAAGLYAVSPLAVRDAHFATTDTLAGCLAALTIFALVRFADDSKVGSRRWILAAVAAGLTMATKYSVAPVVPVAALAVVAIERSRGGSAKTAWLHGAVTGLVSIAVFCAINPWLLIEGVSQLSTELGAVFAFVYRSRLESSGMPLPGLAALGKILVFGPAGVLGAALATLGTAVGIAGWKQRPGAAAAALALVACAAPLLPAQMLPFRYAVPLLPLLAICLAIGLKTALEALTSLPARTAIWVGLIVFGAVGATQSLALDQQLHRVDTRVLAGRWIEENLPESVPVVLPGAPEAEPQLHESAASLTRRSSFAVKRYGTGPAELITLPYRLRIETWPSATGREIYRQPRVREVPRGEVCLVLASYPLPMVGDKSGLARQLLNRGKVLERVRIRGLLPGAEGLVLDPTDAFFLPLPPLDLVERPGPDLEILRLELPPRGQRGGRSEADR